MSTNSFSNSSARSEESSRAFADKRTICFVLAVSSGRKADVAAANNKRHVTKSGLSFGAGWVLRAFLLFFFFCITRPLDATPAGAARASVGCLHWCLAGQL